MSRKVEKTWTKFSYLWLENKVKNEPFNVGICMCIGKGAKSMINKYIGLYGRRLYGLCLTLCANTHDAEDLYQETWLKVVKNISKYDTTQDFEPWLTKVCVNTYRNTLRRIRNSPIFNGFATTEEKTLVLENVAVEEKEDYTDLHEAIHRLPEKLRMTVILFYFKEMDVNETAKILGIPSGTVKSRLSKARNLLKEVLTSETDIRF